MKIHLEFTFFGFFVFKGRTKSDLVNRNLMSNANRFYTKRIAPVTKKSVQSVHVCSDYVLANQLSEL